MSPSRATVPSLFALVSLAAAPAVAQDPEAGVPVVPNAIEVSADGFVIPEGDVPVADLIDAAARFLLRNILWTPEELRQPTPFTFQRRLALDARGCEELVSSLLASRSLVMVPIDEQKKVYEVIHMQGPRAREIVARAVDRTPEQVLARPDLREWVLVALPLQHINAQYATNALRPFLTSGGMNQLGLMIGTLGTDQTLVLSGLTDQVAAAIRVIQRCDKPLSERDPNQHELKQTVDSLRKQVQELQQQLDALQQTVRSIK